MSEKKSDLKTSSFRKYLLVVLLILAAVAIALLFYRQKIETTQTVVKNITSDWQTYKSDKYGFSFKYPKDWSITPTPAKGIDPVIKICKNESARNSCIGDEQLINVRVLDQRSFETGNPNDAIQISIPFDKKNYLIFSTTTSLSDEQKEIFYNIPVTLKLGK